MKHFSMTILISVCLVQFAFSQNQQSEIDSLVRMMRTAGREWNDYANPLIKIGEPAVPALIKNAEDKNLAQWNRRISVMTLNQIHSLQWKEPALKMLFDKNEDPILRNHATAGLRGFDLSNVNIELWEMYNDVENESYKSNLAYLLLTADTAMAYKAFYELYHTKDGHIQKGALLNLAQLRPAESTGWYVKGIQLDDWMTSNLAMDSLIVSKDFKSNDLISLYKQANVSEESRWRIVYVFGKRNEPESLPFLFEAFQNESWLIHTEATVALSRFEADQLLGEIKVLKNDSKSFIRNNAKWVIRQLKLE